LKKADSETKKEKQEFGAAAFVVNCYEWVEALILSLIIVTVLFSFAMRIVSVSGPSMLPTLRSDDRVLLFSMFYQPRQGDVVVITHTRGLSEPIIKRVIALENQTVDIDFQSGTVVVDGKKMDESRYIRNGITTQPSDYRFPLTVPKGSVFVLGDNRPVSNDSRSSDVGMVDQRLILGRAEWVLYPFGRFGKIN
jgi:signal peptidase I